MHRLGALHDHPLLNILFTFTLTVTFSICIAYVMNLSKFGKYIVGGIGKMKYETYYQSYKTKFSGLKGGRSMTKLVSIIVSVYNKGQF